MHIWGYRMINFSDRNEAVMVFFLDPFFYEIVISGLLAGVMYSLVALGFVLILRHQGF